MAEDTFADLVSKLRQKKTRTSFSEHLGYHRGFADAIDVVLRWEPQIRRCPRLLEKRQQTIRRLAAIIRIKNRNIKHFKNRLKDIKKVVDKYPPTHSKVPFATHHSMAAWHKELIAAVEVG